MYQNSYVYKFINQLVQDLPIEANHYLFVKHYDAVVFTEELLSSSIPMDSGILLLCHEFTSTQMQGAFEPFLDWIRNLYFTYYQDMTPEDFIEACNVYPLHKSLFISYLQTESCHRDEDIIIYEMNYERIRMNQSILSILSYLAASRPLVLVLNSAHFAPKSTIDLLQAFIDSASIKNLGIIVSYNEVSQPMPYAAEEWKDLIKQADDKHRLIDFGVTKRKQVIEPTIQFSPHILSFPSYIPMLHNMVHTLAIEQANYYLDILYHKLEVEHSIVAKELKEQILYLYSLTAVYLGDYSKALLLLDKLNETISPDTDPVMYFECIYFSGVAYTYNGLYDLGVKKSKECLAHVPEENKDYYTFKAHLLEYIAVFRGWTTIFLQDFHLEYIDLFFEEAKKYQYLNHLAHIYTFAYGNSLESELGFLQQGIDLALQLNNLYFAIEIYKKNILVVSAYGKFDLAEEYYKKCIDLLAYCNNPIEEANTYAGLGYNSSVSGDYEKANDYYNKAIAIYYRFSSLDSISEMLYNKAINAILAQDYENAILYITKCIEILEKLKEFKLKVCNTSKLYGLAALSYFWLDSEYNCSLCLASAKRYLSHLLDCNDEVKFYLWDDDLFLYYFVTGLLNKKSNEHSYAQSDFDHAYYFMMRSKGNLFFTYHQFAVEQADLYFTLGKKEKGTRILEDCMEYADQHVLKKQYDIARCALEKEEPANPSFNLNMGEITIEMIDELTNHLATQKELERKEKHIEFLSTCQDMISQEQKKDALIQTTIVHIQNHFLLDQIILFTNDGEQLQPFYFAEEFPLTQEHIQLITTKLSYYPRGFIVSRMEKRYEEFYDITNIFGTDEITYFICIPIIMDNKIQNVLIGYTRLKDNFVSNFSPLTEGELTVLRFSFKQLVDSIDRIDFNKKILEYNNELKDVNDKLQQSAVTDILTDLLNRQGFMKLVGTAAIDWSEKEKAGTDNLTILYIDLDSFKYYNDTFGHAVGDYILVRFANILKKIAGKTGYAVRYGGDEFLLALPDTSIEQAETTAKSIYTELELQNYFIDGIPHPEDVILDIPKEHYISCSIGIACTDYEHGCDINETLKHADEALYDVKKHGKRTYRIW
ncbi:MAG: diguanylate cyclase [Lachnospiraceae bacterium]|nr:diguanylate cyclase [Lachnospiraceae bacterium]